MAKVVMKWNLNKLNLMITKMLLNKFDCFIAIEGNRGLGKSTLAWHIAKGVSNNFRKIAKETGGKNSPYFNHHRFNPASQIKNPDKNKFIVYKRDDVINFYNEWNKTAIGDEAINVAFNREFWAEDQKNLIKMINMNRDHCDLFIACVPQFQTMDNQIKNLCKIRITVVRRGLAVIQTPNKTIYNKDKWDSANNERIEREWLKRGSGMPQYSRLNTFRGVLRFKKLSPKSQSIYDKIKIEERNVIRKDLGVTDGEKKKDPVENLVDTLVRGGIRNSNTLEGFAMSMGVTVDGLRNQIRKKLLKRGMKTSVADYYWDKKAKKVEDLLA